LISLSESTDTEFLRIRRFPERFTWRPIAMLPLRQCAPSYTWLISSAVQVAVVSVGFPATHFLFSRARICISAAHTKDDLHQALQVVHAPFHPLTSFLSIIFGAFLTLNALTSQ
jgi:hypothetical protein